MKGVGGGGGGGCTLCKTGEKLTYNPSALSFIKGHVSSKESTEKVLCNIKIPLLATLMFFQYFTKIKILRVLLKKSLRLKAKRSFRLD